VALSRLCGRSNGCIFAYGQTGTGKTHTMQGFDLDSAHSSSSSSSSSSSAAAAAAAAAGAGLVPRILSHIFAARLEREDCADVLVRCSYLEIYNEAIFDLLTPQAGGGGGGVVGGGGGGGGGGGSALKLREDSDGRVAAQGATWELVMSAAEADQLFRRGVGGRCCLLACAPARPHRNACEHAHECCARMHAHSGMRTQCLT
jgi:hypothetical protein